MTKRSFEPGYVTTEEYVRAVLHIFGQHDDADDPRLVGKLASRILRALPEWEAKIKRSALPIWER